MKKIRIVLIVLISSLTIAFNYQERTPVGRWEKKLPNGSIFGGFFKADHTYTGYVDKKVFVSGGYEFKKDLLTLIDSGCDKGIYRITFFSDSIRFSVVSDTCRGRREGTDKMVLGLVKSK